MPRREVLIEMVRMGGSVKVTAMDTKTMVEVSIVGNASAGEAVLKATVLRKLEYVLAKREGKGGSG